MVDLSATSGTSSRCLSSSSSPRSTSRFEQQSELALALLRGIAKSPAYAPESETISQHSRNVAAIMALYLDGSLAANNFIKNSEPLLAKVVIAATQNLHSGISASGSEHDRANLPAQRLFVEAAKEIQSALVLLALPGNQSPLAESIVSRALGQILEGCGKLGHAIPD